MEGPYQVDVLPPIDRAAPLPRKGAALGEDSVGIVLELVVRDVKMLSRTALQRPWPVVIGLAQERLEWLRGSRAIRLINVTCGCTMR